MIDDVIDHLWVDKRCTSRDADNGVGAGLGSDGQAQGRVCVLVEKAGIAHAAPPAFNGPLARHPHRLSGDIIRAVEFSDFNTVRVNQCAHLLVLLLRTDDHKRIQPARRVSPSNRPSQDRHAAQILTQAACRSQRRGLQISLDHTNNIHVAEDSSTLAK